MLKNIYLLDLTRSQKRSLDPTKKAASNKNLGLDKTPRKGVGMVNKGSKTVKSGITKIKQFPQIECGTQTDINPLVNHQPEREQSSSPIKSKNNVKIGNNTG